MIAKRIAPSSFLLAMNDATLLNNGDTESYLDIRFGDNFHLPHNRKFKIQFKLTQKEWLEKDTETGREAEERVWTFQTTYYTPPS